MRVGNARVSIRGYEKEDMVFFLLLKLFTFICLSCGLAKKAKKCKYEYVGLGNFAITFSKVLLRKKCNN